MSWFHLLSDRPTVHLFLATVVGVFYGGPSLADEVWTLNSAESSAWKVHGQVTSAAGIQGRSLVFDGTSLLTISNSGQLNGGESGFTLTAWVNPYFLSGEQQMLVAKNQYSLNERQWGVMIDQDNRFRLYVHQGRWVTVSAAALPTPGHWHLLGVVIRLDTAELWLNGQRQGTVELSRPVPQTAAPVTLAGVNDNGRIRQNFSGALDEVCLFNQPLSAEQMEAAWTPVTATHAIPKVPEPVALWNGDSIPRGFSAEVLEDLTFHVIKKYEPAIDGYGFLHGVALEWHRGRLFASFGHNKGSENTLTEEGRYTVSDDGGRTWSPVKTIDIGTDRDDLAVSHGVFLSTNDRLWAFLGSFYGTRQRVHTRAYRYDDTTAQWVPQGTVVGGGFWPMTRPVKMHDGNWIMPGLVVGQGNPAGVAISDGDDLTKWALVVQPKTKGLRNMWGESSLLVDGPQLTNIVRYGGKPLALATFSRDFGRTWSPLAESNLPMAASKPCAGVLSSGQRYLICSTTADGRNRRSPLTIAVSRPGESSFSQVFVIRHAVFDNGPGESDRGAALSYPYAIEQSGQLYVGYSNNGNRSANNNSAELAVIPIEKLRIK